jgi:ribonuclease I
MNNKIYEIKLLNIRMIFLKQVLFLFFLFSAKYFLVPPLPASSPSSPASSPSYSYSPVSCSVTNYDFTFIFDENESAFKVHGLWPEQCAECLTCGYPSCCDATNMSYVFPSDPGQIAFLNTRWFNATTQEECLNKHFRDNDNDLVPLFEHEFFKHASCTVFRQNASEFVEQVMRLYETHYKTHVENQCAGYKQLWLNLDGNFAYNNVTKCI